MVRDDKFNATVWRILRKIREAQLFLGDKRWLIVYRVGNNPTYELAKQKGPTLTQNEFYEELVLRKLLSFNLFTRFEFRTDVMGYKIEVDDSKFDKLFDAYKSKTGYFDYKNGNIVFRHINADSNNTYFTNKKQDNNSYQINWINNQIWVNNKYLLAKPIVDRENELVFNYLYKKPNEDISKQELEKELGIKLIKTISKIISELGFTGSIRKAFFAKSSEKSVVNFRQQVTVNDIEKLNINLELFIKELNNAHSRRTKIKAV